MAKVKQLPNREQVPIEHTWDLGKLFADDEAWEREFTATEKRIPRFAKFAGTLGTDAESLAKCLKFDSDFDRRCDRLGAYAYLKAAQDQGNATYQRMVGRYQHLATRAAEAAAFIRPELLAIPERRMKRMLQDPKLSLYRLSLDRILRYRPHTLSDREEKLLAMQGEMASTASKAFRQLLDVDLRFGEVTDSEGKRVELTNSNFGELLRSPDRAVRKEAFHRYYDAFEGHRHTLAATLQGSIHKDVYQARVRGYKSSLQRALFADDVPETVYDNLISTVRRHLPAVHRYYDVRRRALKLREIRHYDTYTPIVSQVESRFEWDQAVETVIASLAPLGERYVSVLSEGLRGRWCDRYPNRGKQSGAFSYGTYDGLPYILMNYHPTVLNDLFTLAHEAGHSMHSWFSIERQPYEYHSYSIFVAEVASTFNERLLSRHLLREATDERLKALLISNEIDDIRGTIVRQTMFAEFEKAAHAMAEAGEPLTVEALRGTYRKLLDDYFGPDFAIDDALSLECLRIPHFYRSFYVYQYATGLSAAVALSRRVTDGGRGELDDYLNFLSAGCSKFPLELLRDAGVDMTGPEPIDAAMQLFAARVEELETLLRSIRH